MVFFFSSSPFCLSPFFIHAFLLASSAPAFVSLSLTFSADFQRPKTPPPSSACGSQTTSPTCLCLSSLSLSLSTHSLSRFLPSLHSPSSSSSLSRHYGDTLSLYQDKLVLARSLSLCVCVLLELKEFSSDVNIQNKNYIVNNKM